MWDTQSQQASKQSDILPWYAGTPGSCSRSPPCEPSSFRCSVSQVSRPRWSPAASTAFFHPRGPRRGPQPPSAPAQQIINCPLSGLHMLSTSCSKNFHNIRNFVKNRRMVCFTKMSHIDTPRRETTVMARQTERATITRRTAPAGGPTPTIHVDANVINAWVQSLSIVTNLQESLRSLRP